MINIIFWIVLAILILFSYLDIKYMKLSNWLVLALLIFGVTYRLVNHKVDFIIPTIFMFIFGLILWYFNAIGAADAKLLVAITPLLPYNGFGNMVVVVALFILIWGFISSIYGFMSRIRTNKKHIPLIPIFLISYIIINLIPIY